MIDEKIIDVDWQETRRFLEEKYFSKIRELSKKYDYPCENIAIDFNWVFGLIEKIENQPKTDWIPCEEEEEPCITMEFAEECKEVAKKYQKPMTNADRIRNMTDEELAGFLLEVNSTIQNCMIMDCKYDDEREGLCKNCFFEWLQAEVDEEN